MKNLLKTLFLLALLSVLMIGVTSIASGQVLEDSHDLSLADDACASIESNMLLNGSRRVQIHTLYADGSIDCEGADDLSLPAGQVILAPNPRGIRFAIRLYNAAANWDYYAEVQENLCFGGPTAIYYGIRTDENGHAVFQGFYEADYGPHLILVDVVSHPPDNVPPDERHREIGMDYQVEIWVPFVPGLSP